MTQPIATDAEEDQWGATCRLCREPVYLDRIEKGKPVWWHTSHHPWAEKCRG